MNRRIPFVILCFLLAAVTEAETAKARQSPQAIHVDSRAGNDAADGLSSATAWRSIEKVKAAKLVPGDTIRFKRGSKFSGALSITNQSGQASLKIVQ